MAKRACIIPIVLCVLLILIMAAWGGRESVYPAGRIRIGDVQADVMTTHGAACDCCPPLWDGGIATTTADLSAVQVGDWATLTLLDDTRLVLECAAIFPCVRVGDLLVSQYGFIQAEGDIIIYDKYKAYMFVRL